MSIIVQQNKALSMQNEKFAKDLEVYKKFGVWPGNASPLGQFLLRYGSSFVRGTGFIWMLLLKVLVSMCVRFLTIIRKD